MNYESIKKILTAPNPIVWVNGKKIAQEHGVDVWEYSFGAVGGPRVLMRGIDSNNPKFQFASDEYGVFVDGKKLELEKSQYLDLFGQAGYLYSVIQPMKLKEQSLKH